MYGRMEGVKCEPNCTCKRHKNSGNFTGTSSPCLSGCTCKRHPQFQVAVGDQFGRWTVIESGVTLTYPSGTRKAAVARCDCGTVRTLNETQLLNKRSESCGCLRQEKLLAATTTHGLSGSPLYAKWKAMMDRCGPKNRQRKDYMDRGIRVCEEWKNPETFVHWIAENLGPCPDGMSLDRIDNDGNYEPGNVRWATHSEQMINRRSPTRRRHV